MSWAGPSRLVVVGREAGGVQQVRYIQTDGSTSRTAGGLPGLNEVSAVAAAEDEEPPLVAYSEDGHRAAAAGRAMADRGRGDGPVYPG